MSHDALGGLIGARLQLIPEEADSKEAYTVHLIGYLPERSMIVTAPERQGVPAYVDTGDRFVARFENGPTDFSFDTTTLRTYSQPYPHMHLTYPDDIKGVLLRRGHRVNTELPGLRLIMAGGNRQLATSLIDVSISGGRIVAKESIGDVNNRFAIELAIGPGERTIRLGCVIRYILVRGDGMDREYHHGVAFTDLDAIACGFLQNYIHDAISMCRDS